MMLLKIAFRNILRNGRRSLMTASAIAVGAVALILFGEYNDFTFLGLQTQAVIGVGHLSVFQKGYFDFGSGNPAAYSISNYRSVIQLIKDDPVLKPMLNVVTPTVSLFGIAGNFSIDASKTFFGTGFVPSDRDKMRHWDEYGINRGYHIPPLGLRDSDINHGIIGMGMARILGLCRPLKIADCPPMPKQSETIISNAPAPSVNLTELATRDRQPSEATPIESLPRLDLLGATAGGAPNVVTFYVNQAQNQGIRELDDSFIGMNLPLAQDLLYGRGEHKAVSIVVQLHRTEDMERARARLNALFAEHKLPLEVHDFTELNSQYIPIRNFLSTMFVFLSVIMGTIVVFTIVNTMSMSVMERTNEIGTARAMGVRRGGIRRQFLIEGWMLGLIGATAGVIVASFLSVWFNHAHIMYTPPGQARSVPIMLLTGDYWLLTKVWVSLVLIATIGSLVPANRAARMKVVDALRHV
ncbi:MAG: ABC transporter permease [Alphaproteobacteria bacterium]|nr:FtsX-like permease family protein [Alphaproteobacteria bacterium]MDE2110874.1 ABC transporter permease [Alphaproteobacteria bacterium]MDE2494103.1 ABC transporter permease [Alphaproteobacteria bacterium]